MTRKIAREMVRSAKQMTNPSLGEDVIRFEQPLTERMRTFLRIEFLYRQALFHAAQGADFSARAAVASLLEILSIVGRGDTRAEVLKELDRHAEMLERFKRRAGVDASRCASLLDDIGTLKARMSALGTKFAAPLTECEFLTTIRHRSSIPGGTCMFDLPDYGYWLHLPREERGAQLEEWLDRLKPLCDAIDEVLWLVREAADPLEQTATKGLYSRQLDRAEHRNLVRVELPGDARIFPEISGSRHRFTVRFLAWQGVDARPKPVGTDVVFMLALC